MSGRQHQPPHYKMLQKSVIASSSLVVSAAIDGVTAKCLLLPFLAHGAHIILVLPSITGAKRLSHLTFLMNGLTSLTLAFQTRADDAWLNDFAQHLPATRLVHLDFVLPDFSQVHALLNSTRFTALSHELIRDITISAINWGATDKLMGKVRSRVNQVKLWMVPNGEVPRFPSLEHVYVDAPIYDGVAPKVIRFGGTEKAHVTLIDTHMRLSLGKTPTASIYAFEPKRN